MNKLLSRKSLYWLYQLFSPPRISVYKFSLVLLITYSLVFLTNFKCTRCIPFDPLTYQQRPRSDTLQFTMLNYVRTRTTLAEFRGKHVLMVFWATRCIPCIQQMPQLDSFQKEFSERLQIILLDVKDMKDDINGVNSFLGRWESKAGILPLLPILIESSIKAGSFAYQQMPGYMWIGPAGEYRSVVYGPLTKMDIERNLNN
jgi:thiol-disulfide isomerase/thioredoxin